MEYGLKQRKKKKWWLIPVIAIAVVFVGISVVGIILGSGSDERLAISKAVSENAELHRQIDDLNAQIASLNEQLQGVQSELDARPTTAPEETANPDEDGEVSAYEGTSPRNYEG